MVLTSLNVYPTSHPLSHTSLRATGNRAEFGSSDFIGLLRGQSEMTLNGMSSDPHNGINSLMRLVMLEFINISDKHVTEKYTVCAISREGLSRRCKTR